MDPLLNHPCVRRGFRRISAGGFKIDYYYITWSALEEAPPSWCCWWWCRTMRGPFSVFFSSPYRGLLVSGQSSRSLSVAARSMLRPHVASFPLTMLHLSLILTLLPFPSRVSALRFPLFLIRLQMLFLPGPTPFGYESATGVGETAICAVRQGQKRRGGVSSNLPPSL